MPLPTGDDFNLANITLRDLRDLEGVLGKPIGSLFAALAGGDISALGADLMAGLFWLRLRKDDPAVTLDDVLEHGLRRAHP